MHFLIIYQKSVISAQCVQELSSLHLHIIVCTCQDHCEQLCNSCDNGLRLAWWQDRLLLHDHDILQALPLLDLHTHEWNLGLITYQLDRALLVCTAAMHAVQHDCNILHHVNWFRTCDSALVP